jgi:hypothetical protein
MEIRKVWLVNSKTLEKHLIGVFDTEDFFKWLEVEDIVLALANALKGEYHIEEEVIK